MKKAFKVGLGSIGKFRPNTCIALTILAALQAGQSANAANQYWDTSTGTNLTPGNGTWDAGVTANWATGTTPGSTAPGVWVNGNDARFDGIGTSVVTISGTVIANSVSTNFNGATTTINGGTLQLGNGTTGSLTNGGNTAFTINSAIVLNGNVTLNPNSGTIVLGGDVSEMGGAKTFTKAGASGATLSSTNNSYSGVTNINAGTLTVNSVGTTGSNSSIGTNGTVNIGATTVAGGLAYTGTGETTNKVINLAGTTGGATITQSGTGNLKFASNLTAGTSGAKLLTLAGSTAGTGEFAGNIVDSASGATSLTKSGTGTWTLSGANSYTGATTVSAGALTLNGSFTNATATSVANATLNVNNASALSSGTLAINAGAVVNNTSGTAVTSQSNNPVITIGGDFSFGTAGSTSANNLNLGTGAVSTSAYRTITLLGTGTSWTLGGALTYTGATSSNMVVVGTGNTLNLGGYNISSTAAGVTGTFTGSGIVNITGVVANGFAGTNNLGYGGTGTLILGGANTYTGTTTLNSATGTIQLNNASNGGLGSGTLNLTAGTLQALTASRSISNAVTLSAATISGSQNLTINGKLTGLTGGARTLTSSITGGNGLTLTDIDINTETANARNLTLAGTGPTTITGVVANGNGTTANGLTVTNTGLTTMSGASTYTGATTISAGKVNLTGSLGATAVAVNGGGALGGSGTIGTGVSAAGGTVTVAGGTSAATRGTIDLADGSIGTLTIQGNSTPGTFLTVGSVTANNNSILNFETGASSVDKIVVTNGGLMTLNLGGATINLSALPSTTLANGTYDLLTYGSGSTFTGAFSLSTTEVGSSRYLLNNTATAEQLIVTAGAGSTAYWTGSQSSVWDTISPTTNFTSDAAGTTPTGVPISTTNVIFTATSAGNLTTTLGQNDFTINSLTLSGTGTSGTGAVTIGGTRTLTLMGTGTNAITVQAGAGADNISTKVALGASQTWQNNNTANALIIDGATNLGANTLTLSGVASSTYTIRAGMTGTGGVIIDTLGTVNMGAGTSGNAINNTFTGGLTLNSGTLVLGGGSTGGGTGGILGAGLLTINGGTINATGNIANSTMVITGQVWNNDWTYTGPSKTLKLGTGAVSLGTAAGTSRTINTSGSGGVLTVDGVISNGTTANSIVKDGIGTLTLGGASAYTGSTTVNAGTLRITGSNDRLPTGTILAVNGGATANNAGTLDLNSLNQTVAGLTGGSGTFKGTVTNNNAGTGTSTLTVTGTSTFDGVIKDGTTAFVALTKNTGGTLTLTGANTYTGATTVSAGTLLVSGTLSSSSAVAVNGGIFNYTGASALGSNVTVAGGNFKYNSAAAYTGGLTFTSGTVSGTGNLSGIALSIGTGQIQAPGNSTGTQAVGALTWANGGTFQFELNDATGTAGSTVAGWDLATTPSLNITAGAGQFTLQVVSLNALQTAGMAANFNSGTSYNWLFLDAASTITSFSASQFAFDLTGFQNTYGGTFGVARGDTVLGGDDSQIYLTYTAVPEPSTYALLGMGIGALWALRRGKKKKDI